MNNNNLDQVTMRSSKRKRSRIPMKFSVDTSIGIGEVQPFMCQKVLANSRKRFKAGNVVRLAPMVAPTFGQMKLHHNFAFVGMSDIISSDLYNAYLTQKPVAFGNGLVQVPKHLPEVSLQVLSAFALVGAKWTAYSVVTNTSDSANRTFLRRYFYDVANSGTGHLSKVHWGDTSSDQATSFLTCLAGYSAAESPDLSAIFYTQNKIWSANPIGVGLYGSEAAFSGYNSAVFNVGRLFGWSADLWIPCANSEFPLFLVERDASVNDFIRDLDSYRPNLDNLESVNHDNYDFLIRVALPYGSDSSSSLSVEFAVKLSDFGRRWFNILNVLGYGFDLSTDKPVDLPRFVALYLAYFNSFGITLYQGMETLHSRRVMASYESNYFWDWTTAITNSVSAAANFENVREFFCFLVDLTNMWYTEEQDWITAHTRQAVVSSDNGIIAEMNASGTPNVGGVINVNSASSTDVPRDGSPIYAPVDTTASGSAGHAYINNVLHSQLDSEVLKRLYKVTNRNTIAGRRIADLLKAQGLGQYVKQCRSTFIGHSSIDINIFDVTATADGFNSKDDFSSVLGEYVGKGVGDGDSKWFSYETPENGYIFDLVSVVPESGWVNGVDLTVFDVRPAQQYQPEYDGLGLELSPKSVVTGVSDSYGIGALKDSLNEQSYGFIPRFTRYKVARNVQNGGYALHSVRKNFQAYSLDKIVRVGERVLLTDWRSAANSSYGYVAECKLLTPSRVPIASTIYRYLGRYPWMAEFMRIFTDLGRDALAQSGYWYDDFSSIKGESESSWFLIRTDDPINVHNVYLMDYYAPVLPIEDSFETHDDGNNGPTDMSIGKA